MSCGLKSRSLSYKLTHSARQQKISASISHSGKKSQKRLRRIWDEVLWHNAFPFVAARPSASRRPVCTGAHRGAGQWDGCAVSAGLADALFGSREVTGLELTVKGEKRCVTGVVEGKECFLICPDVTASDAGYTAASLEIENGNNPRGTIQNLLQSAGLSENGTELLPTGTLRQIINAVAWIPLGVAALLFLHQLWRLAPLGKMGRQVAAFALLLMAALALPDLLAALPRWLVPSRWSDMNFWMDLGNLAKQSLMAFGSLTNSVRDQLLGTQILAFGGYLLGLLAGALLLGLKNCIENRCHHP